MEDKPIPLIVTTLHKGVFFGYGVPTTEKVIRIERVRMVVFWSKDVKGVVGLASIGPSAECRISPEAPAITLQDVTGIMECSKCSAKRFQEAPWHA